jgi:hypothetical protein
LWPTTIGRFIFSDLYLYHGALCHEARPFPISCIGSSPQVPQAHTRWYASCGHGGNKGGIHIFISAIQGYPCPSAHIIVVFRSIRRNNNSAVRAQSPFTTPLVTTDSVRYPMRATMASVRCLGALLLVTLTSAMAPADCGVDMYYWGKWDGQPMCQSCPVGKHSGGCKNCAADPEAHKCISSCSTGSYHAEEGCTKCTPGRFQGAQKLNPP